MLKCQLKVSSRAKQDHGKNAMRRLRSSGQIPANLLLQGKAQSIQLAEKDIRFLKKKGLLSSTLIEIEDNANQKHLCLLQDIQYHPVNEKILHIDFYRIQPGQKVTLNIPIVSAGIPVGVRAGGILEHQLDYLKITTFPEKIIEKIEVDISNLQIGKNIKVSQVTLPKEWETTLDPDTIVFKVSHSRMAMSEEEDKVGELSAAEVPTVKSKDTTGTEEKDSSS